jgi:hypothetical protein
MEVRIEARLTTCRGCVPASPHRPTGAGGAGARRSAAKPTQAQRKSLPPREPWRDQPALLPSGAPFSPPGPGHARCPAPATSSGEIEGVGPPVEDPSHRAAPPRAPAPDALPAGFDVHERQDPLPSSTAVTVAPQRTSRAVGGEVIWVLERGTPSVACPTTADNAGPPSFCPSSKHSYPCTLVKPKGGGHGPGVDLA